MANNLPPIPQDPIEENFKWREWFKNLGSYITQVQLGGLTYQDIGGLAQVAHTGDYNDLVNTPTGLLPYGAFSSHTTQSVATINTPTRVALDTTDYSQYMHFVSGDGIHVDKTGLYNIQFSVQLTNGDNTSHDMAIWLRHGTNGSTATDVAWTNSVQSVQGTHGGQPGYQVLAANYFIRLQASDFIEFWWSTNSTQVQLQALPAITTPFVTPAAPSVVVTLTYISS